jgi:hypothetical protein
MPSPTIEDAKIAQVEDFKASLSPKDKIIHELAATMLKTRYDPKRTNAFLKFNSEKK